MGPGTQLLKRGWTVFHSGAAAGESCRAGVGLLMTPPAQPPCVGVLFSTEREGDFPMPSGWDMSLTVVSAYGPNRSAEVPGLLAGPGIVLLGESNAHVHLEGCDREEGPAQSEPK